MGNFRVVIHRSKLSAVILNSTQVNVARGNIALRRICCDAYKICTGESGDVMNSLFGPQHPIYSQQGRGSGGSPDERDDGE